jgi:hypothetical protein
MSRRSIVIEKIALDGPRDKAMGYARRVLNVEMNYQLGGMSYWDYKNHPRGFWLSVTPRDESDNGSYGWIIAEGGKTLIEASARYNEKKLLALAATVKSHPLYAAFLLKIAAQETFADTERLSQLLTQAAARGVSVAAL